MAKLTIGGHEHSIDPMNFVALEMAWPFLEVALATPNPISSTNAALAVIAAGLMETEKFDPKDWDVEATGKDDADREWPRAPQLIHIDMTNALRRRLKANEVGMVKVCLFEMIDEGGIEIGPAGEQNPVAAPDTSSPETAIDTSLNSLPLESREAAGTA